MSNIKIQPEELRGHASTIAGKREEIVGAVDVLKQQIDEVGDAMEGEAIQALLESFNDLYPTLHDKFPEIVEGIETQLKTVAQVMEEADAKLQQAMR